MVSKRKVQDTPKDYIVFQGSQPVFTSPDKKCCQLFIESEEERCKLMGIDTSVEEHSFTLK